MEKGRKKLPVSYTIDAEIKKIFEIKCRRNLQKFSTRLEYLIREDIKDFVIIPEEIKSEEFKNE